MNTDRRRILGPLDAVKPVFSSAPKAPRQSSGVRKFFARTGLSQNANGSAYLEVGDLIIEVAVFGPRPIKGSFVDRSLFSVETKFLPYITQPNEVLYNAALAHENGRTALTDIEQRISTFVETAFLPVVLLEKYPKSTIDVFINVLSFNAAAESLPNLVAWAVNCTLLALVDLAVEVRDLVTCGHARLDGSPVLDAPVGSGPETVAAFLPMQNQEVSSIWVLNYDGSQDLAVLTDACQEMALHVRRNLNGFLLELSGAKTEENGEASDAE